ncbi:MAG: NAD(P)/FAD-dependent oxidoreductase, partial [Chloroflexota bacterium]
IPGGYAQEFRRGKYRFEAALHAMDGVGPGGWAYPILKDLDVLESVQFQRLDPFYTASYPEHEIVAHADPLTYEAELIRNFPHEKDGIRAMWTEMIEIYWQVRRFIFDGELDLRPVIEQIPTVYPKMLAVQTISLDEFLSQFIKDQKLRAIFTTLWPYYGLPPSELNAATFIFPFVSFHLFGAYYPEGGSMAMSRALEKTILNHAGQVLYRQTVKRIEIQDGRAVAVETEKGLRVEAEAIISNANLPDTLLKFVGKQYLPEQYQAKIEAEPNAVATLCVYLGLDREIKAEGYHHHELFIVDGYNPEEEYQAALDGHFNKTGIVVSNYDISDPTCAPEGGSVVVLTSMAHWDTDNQWGTGGNLEGYSKNPQYLELKEAAADELIERAEKFIPGLRKSIKYKEIATPMTNWRYSLNPGGSIYGSAQTVGNMYFNRLTAKTPIPNLFLAGAWAFGGGMSAALLSGRETSRLVKGYLEGQDLSFLMNMAIPDIAVSEQPGDNTAQSPASSEKPAQPARKPSSPGQAPAVTLKAIGSGREVTLNAIARPTVLLLHAQDTAETAQRINQAIRALPAYQSPASVFIANLVDLHSVPKFFRGIAERAMRESYEKAALGLPPTENPQDFIVILPDWDGSLTKALGLKDTGKIAALAVLDAHGNLIGTYQGSEPEQQALALLQQIA